jgi:hypothetical protein
VTSSIVVVVLEKQADVLAFLECAASAVCQIVLVVAPELLKDSEFGAALGVFMCIVTGNKGGVSVGAGYEGLAPAVLDSIASKVGTALCARQHAATGESPRSIYSSSSGGGN